MLFPLTQINKRTFNLLIFSCIISISFTFPSIVKAKRYIQNLDNFAGHTSHEGAAVLLKLSVENGEVEVGPSAGLENLIGLKILDPDINPGDIGPPPEKIVNEFPTLKGCGPYVLVMEVITPADPGAVRGLSWRGSAVTQEIEYQGRKLSLPENQQNIWVTAFFNPSSPGVYSVSTHGYSGMLEFTPKGECSPITVKNSNSGISANDNNQLPFLVRTREKSSKVTPLRKLKFAWNNNSTDTPNWKIKVKSKYGYKSSASYELVADTVVKQKWIGKLKLDLTDQQQWKKFIRKMSEP